MSALQSLPFATALPAGRRSPGGDLFHVPHNLQRAHHRCGWPLLGRTQQQHRPLVKHRDGRSLSSLIILILLQAVWAGEASEQWMCCSACRCQQPIHSTPR